jgi:hypothetical protein
MESWALRQVDDRIGALAAGVILAMNSPMSEE